MIKELQGVEKIHWRVLSKYDTNLRAYSSFFLVRVGDDAEDFTQNAFRYVAPKYTRIILGIDTKIRDTKAPGSRQWRLSLSVSLGESD